MCLGIPGEVLSISGEGIFRTGRLSFSGAVREVSLAYTPEAKVGDYVIVHVGFAISLLDSTEAARVFETLKHLGEVDEIPR